MNLRQWVRRSNDQNRATDEEVRELSRERNLHFRLARLVLERNANRLDLAIHFLTPKLAQMNAPQNLPDMKPAVARIAQALVQHEKIFIHGDYDVDGITSVAILVEGLEKMGGVVIPFVPSRIKDGYGLSRHAIQEAKDKGASLILTCDCGTNAVDEVAHAKSLGLDVIVTDHHLPGDRLPEALAIINPQREDSRYPFRSLCGAGVAFVFLVALRAALREQGYFASRKLTEPDLRETLDLLTLAIVADSVPILGDNRIFVTHGLKILEHAVRPGTMALLDQTGLLGKNLNTQQVAFRLIPRLNVAGRLGQASRALELLLEKDVRKARLIAQELEALNEKRKVLGEEVQREAMLQARQIYGDNLFSGDRQAPLGLVLASESWHPGVLGIVASRLAEEFSRPVAIIGFENGEGRGSVRGIAGVNLVEAMAHCKDSLLRFGGHERAAGLSVAKDQLARFRTQFDLSLRQFSDDLFLPRIHFDEDLTLGEIDPEFQEQLEWLEPFGEGNPEPHFAAYRIDVRDARIVADAHLKLQLRQGEAKHEAIGFGFAKRLPNLGKTIDLVFTSRWNEYLGYKNIQLQVKDLR